MTTLKHYSSFGLAALQGALLSPADLDYLQARRDALQANWAKQQIFRTETEMRVSVLNDIAFPTPASKYWQCVREQALMFRELVALGFAYRRTLLTIESLTDQIAALTPGSIAARRLAVDLEEQRFLQLEQEQFARDRVREIRRWDELLAELDDGTFDTADPGAHQLESYRERWRRQTASLQFAGIEEANNLLGQLATADRVAAERAGV